MREMIIVNASSLLHDAEVMAACEALQIQIDRDFLPAWEHHRVPQVTVTFGDINDINYLPKDVWPIFLNKHSPDSGILGWHDDDIQQKYPVHSRVFVGDCMRFGLNWEVTLGHEALEIMLDPRINRTWKMKDGRRAAMEVADAVEADALAYEIEVKDENPRVHKVTNFVLPAYFSTKKDGPFDFCGVLDAPCPALAPGGYMSIQDTSGRWTQIYASQIDGLAGRRTLLQGHRRKMRMMKDD